jgi:hypothetical protein
MALDLTSDCEFAGPAFPEPFVKFSLEAELNRLRLLPRATGGGLRAFWPTYRNHLRQLVSQGGPQRVKNQVVEPLLACTDLGYTSIAEADEVNTREGREPGGSYLVAPNGAKLRFWTAPFGEDLDAPTRRGHAYRFSHARIASRVLLASGERLGLLTNGLELRLLICDPARLDSHLTLALDASWKRKRDLPDSFRLFLAFASPAGVRAIPELIEKARLQQAKVTKDLRVQARLAVEEFIQAVLDHPENQSALADSTDKSRLARQLWREGLITVYRLLFVLKLESTDNPAKCFSFASGSLWRQTFSPGVALAPIARALLDHAASTGTLLETGLRALFRMLSEGLSCTELNVRPMGGALFAPGSTPVLSSLRWPEIGVAHLLNRLLWTTPKRGSTTRERVHYGPLDVEDLGRVYEALLELDPGIAADPMCRLRRNKLEVVVPEAQGERYRAEAPSDPSDESDSSDDDTPDEDAPSAKKTKVEWIEHIAPGRFYLRVGLGRKATGSYYTPHSFVRFLVQETLGPLVARVSPPDDPKPAGILALKVVDKAMGSGHFLVEACRFLGDALYEACRRCDELAADATTRVQAYNQSGHAELEEADAARAAEMLRRVESLPDPDDELLRYLPSRVTEGPSTGFSYHRALAICRRMTAVHCLYGVDKNPLAVELAKLALWIECHAEGMPLTFLDHRLVVGDSLTGPFYEHLLKFPGTQQPLNELFTQNLSHRLTATLAEALQHVRALESSVGLTVADLEAKQAAKARLDRALAPFKLLAAAWSGGVMLGPDGCDDLAYGALAMAVAQSGAVPNELSGDNRRLLGMIATGLGLASLGSWSELHACLSRQENVLVPALSFDLTFPEVFYRSGNLDGRSGFDANLGNPPWEGLDTSNKEFFAAFDFSILELKTDREIELLIASLMANPEIARLRAHYEEGIDHTKRAIRQLYLNVNQSAQLASAATPDLYQMFVERGCVALSKTGFLGLVLPSAFHSNEGAAGIRRLLLNQMRLHSCYSFENRRKLFEIDSRFKFAPIVVEAGAATTSFKCRFYLHDDEWLFSPQREAEQLTYTRQFVQNTTGNSLNFLELSSQSDVPVTEVVYRNSVTTFGRLRGEWNIRPTEELHLSKNRWRLVLTSSLLPEGEIDPRLPEGLDAVRALGALPLFEGKSVHQYSSHWDERPQYCVSIAKMAGKVQRLQASRFYRLGFRTIGRSNDERSGIFTILPPGALCSNSLLPELDSALRVNWRPLALVAIANSYPFDWLLRLAVSANITFNYLDPVPLPSVEKFKALLSHAALRLTCNHAGYAPLWREQVGEAWREAGEPFTWPVLAGDDARWAVRAAIDAVVAQAYGLTREQYAHVLGTFSHSSYNDAPRQCLAAFDELTTLGLDAFTRKHDPYWDIPLNENLPQPVIDLPMPAKEPPTDAKPKPGELFAFETVPAPRGSGVLFTDQPIAPAPRPRGRPRKGG